MKCEYVDAALGQTGGEALILLSPKVKGSSANPSPFAIDLACARFLASKLQDLIREAEQME